MEIEAAQLITPNDLLSERSYQMTLQTQLTLDFTKCFSLSSLLRPCFDLISNIIFVIPGQLRSSFSTKTCPIKPVAPVIATVLPLKYSEIDGLDRCLVWNKKVSLLVITTA